MSSNEFSQGVQKPKCCVDGCNKETRAGGKNAIYCMMHYHRLYRYGTLERSKCLGLTYARKSDGRKLKTIEKDHPLVSENTNNVTYLSRILLYEKHKNDTELKCNWCGVVLNIKTFEADHVDENPENDTIENLVLSCSSCNAERSRAKAYRNFIDKCCVKIELDGKTWTTKEIAEKHGISYNSVNARLKKGWSNFDIVNKPRGKYGPKKI